PLTAMTWPGAVCCAMHDLVGHLPRGYDLLLHPFPEKEEAIMAEKPSSIPTERIAQAIQVIRDEKVLLDRDLARMYGVTTKRLNEQVRRNLDRFPVDFMFQLTAEEVEVLRSQNATSKPGRGGRRYRPYAFTEHGAIMAANVLNSARAVEVSVF